MACTVRCCSGNSDPTGTARDTDEGRATDANVLTRTFSAADQWLRDKVNKKTRADAAVAFP